MSNLRSRIGELSVFGPGWDGYDAKPPTPDVILRALNIADMLGEGWHVFPCADGGVQFEHDNDDEIRVKPDGTYEVMLSGLSVAVIDALMKARRG